MYNIYQVKLAEDDMDKLTREYKELLKNIWHLFYHSNRLWSKDIDEIGLGTALFTALEITMRNPGITQQEIADTVCVDKSCVSRTCRVLEEKGLIRRDKCPNCTHGLRCYPTEMGETVYKAGMAKQCKLIHKVVDEERMTGLADANAALRELVERLQSL